MSAANSEPDFLQQYRERLAAEHQQACQTLSVLCEQLLSLGVQTVTVAYDGYSDSGTIENVQAFDGANQAIALPDDLEQELIELAETLLPGGWEINEGAFGQFTLDVPQRQLVREHNWRIESSQYEEESWQL